jgi:hypothetical protein
MSSEILAPTTALKIYSYFCLSSETKRLVIESTGLARILTFENRVIRRIFGPEREGNTGQRNR